ncbi:MAG: 2,3,4,5-tetrahydropyridine-2,6-dicarboxylate N-succinyltransferase [Alphaproteobacteria bacterium]|nr:2,3,4,5-tetrahydropyridine-2,6-dicarboxylate N-succinyltransferase [Alphaproteobacteria bacterium]
MTEDFAELENTINSAWDEKENINTQTTGLYRAAVKETLNLLDSGSLRVASPSDKGWTVNQWAKKAVILSFRLNPAYKISGGPGDSIWYDKVRSKFSDWSETEFEKAGFRAVPGSIVRHSAYIAPSAVLMPCFINIGAYIGKNTMIDTWSTIGSCAQIGAHCHISGGVGIGGVLEPLQAEPVIIEDNVFVGARSEIAEGMIIEKGSVISMGVFLGTSTKIIDRESGEIFTGRVPAYSVVVSGTLPSDKTLPNGSPAPSLACAVIVKRVDERTRNKTGINELLRD